MEKRLRFETTSASLHILAMLFMLCDHLWGALVPGADWLTCIGRLALPIFAFLLVEGYFHTADIHKYLRRLLIFALLSEIPFNLMMGSRLFYPVHQNMLWSLLLSLCLIHWNEKTKARGKIGLRVLVACLSIVLGSAVGLLAMLDYYHAGVLTVLVFYFFRQKKWWSYLAQLLCLLYINTEILGGYGWDLQLFGGSFFLTRQSFALLALVPIWLYRGRQGLRSKALQLSYYAFYPLHLLILGLLKFL